MLKVLTPPAGLEDLLYDMQIKSEVSISSVDSIIEAHDWSRQFRKYLRDRNLSDDENILRSVQQVLKNFSNLYFQVSCPHPASEDLLPSQQ